MIGKRFRGWSINEIFAALCEDLLINYDYVIKPRRLEVREILFPTIIILNPRRRIITFKERKLSKRYLAGELCFYLKGSHQLKDIAYYSKFWNKISDNGITVNSCYGYKLFVHINNTISQFAYAKQQLLNDKDSRKAVALIYIPENNDLNTKDNPCTMYLQFFIRDNKLILITHMRSNDIWFGLSYDIPFFTIVQEMMLVELNEKYDLKLGEYVHHLGSLHIYKKDYEKAKKLVYENNKRHPGDIPMSIITKKTLKDLPKLLYAEEELKLNKNIELKSDDPFLNEIFNYLKLEK